MRLCYKLIFFYARLFGHYAQLWSLVKFFDHYAFSHGP